MTPDELDAIRERDVDCVPAGYTSAQAARDRRALLAEVDRLTLTVLPEAIARACHDCKEGATKDERARILAAVEVLPVFESEYGNDLLVPLDDVIAIVKGET